MPTDLDDRDSYLRSGQALSLGVESMSKDFGLHRMRWTNMAAWGGLIQGQMQRLGNCALATLLLVGCVPAATVPPEKAAAIRSVAIVTAIGDQLDVIVSRFRDLDSPAGYYSDTEKWNFDGLSERVLEREVMQRLPLAKIVAPMHDHSELLRVLFRRQVNFSRGDPRLSQDFIRQSYGNSGVDAVLLASRAVFGQQFDSFYHPTVKVAAYDSTGMANVSMHVGLNLALLDANTGEILASRFAWLCGPDFNAPDPPFERHPKLFAPFPWDFDMPFDAVQRRFVELTMADTIAVWLSALSEVIGPRPTLASPPMSLSEPVRIGYVAPVCVSRSPKLPIIVRITG